MSMVLNPTCRRERQMCGFRDARRTQAFLSCFGPIRQHFALPSRAARCRAILKECLDTWHSWTVSAEIETVTEKDNYAYAAPSACSHQLDHASALKSGCMAAIKTFEPWHHEAWQLGASTHVNARMMSPGSVF